MRRLIVAAVAAVLGLAVVGAGAAEYGGGAVRVEVRVWQDVEDEREIHVSARPADGSWRTLGMIPLPLDDGVSSTGYNYGDISLDVPLANWASPVTVEVRVWQNVGNSRVIYISTRPSAGSWQTLGTIRLPLDHGFSSDRLFRFGDIAIDVPLPAEGVFSLAGRAGVHGYANGRGDEARFGRWAETSMGLAVDRDGSVVVADFRNHAIRRVMPDGTVTTIAGGGGSGTLDGPAETAQFDGPTDVAIDPEGAIYVADCWSNRIRKITPEGMVTTVAGGDHPEDKWWLRRDGPADQALFLSPCGLALDRYGDLYILEQEQIRRLSPSGWVSTLVGESGLGYRDGPSEHAQFAFLQDIEVDAEGNLYVIDANPYLSQKDGTFNAVRKISTGGWVSTLYRSEPSTEGGPLASPRGLAVTGQGEVYLTNTGRNQIVRIEGRGRLVAVAGSGDDGALDGPTGLALLSQPGALEFAPSGALVVADQGDSMIRVVLPDADGAFAPVALAEIPKIPRLEGVRVGVLAGRGGYRFADVDGFVNGPAREALFNFPHGIALAPDGSVVVADAGNHAIRRISADGKVSTIAGSNGGGRLNGPRDVARFSWPRGVAVDADGTVYVADTGNGLIRKVASDGSVETVGGREIPFSSPTEMAFDPEGNLLFTESNNSRILNLSPDGEVSVVVDEGNAFMYGLVVSDEGTVFYATAKLPSLSIRAADTDGTLSTVFEDVPGRLGGIFSDYVPGLALAPGGALYAVDWHYGRVVRISPDGEAAIVVDRGSFNDSPHFQPADILITPEGDLLVADSGMSVIWKISFDEDAQ